MKYESEKIAPAKFFEKVLCMTIHFVNEVSSDVLKMALVVMFEGA